MLLSEAMDKYIKKLQSEKSTTLNTYKGKVKKYINLNREKDIYTGFSKDNLEEFIFQDGQKCTNKYHAILNFYEFVQREILLIEDVNFPIKLSVVQKIDEQREKNNHYTVGRKASTITYLPDNFDFKLLFESEHYGHLHNDIAEKTIKAVIGLGLSTGFDSQHFFENKTQNYLRLNDVTINPEEILIVHISNSELISQISVTGEYCKYLIEYVNLRKNFKTNSDALFVKMWNGHELNYDPNIQRKIPSDVQNLVLYFLKYISHKLDLPPLYITDLRFNMVYHYLLHTKGSALNEIIRLYGFPTFIQSAFNRFTSKANNETYYAFDFFNLASSTKPEKTDETVDEAEIATTISILEKRLRNSTKVKKIKKIYDDNCQICNGSLTLLDNFKYSEVHHIQPMGKEHSGPDEHYNMLVLCPNHHKLFDIGVIAIDPINLNSLLHIDENNALHTSTIVFKHNLSKTCVRYHYENIFIPLKKELSLM